MNGNTSITLFGLEPIRTCNFTSTDAVGYILQFSQSDIKLVVEHCRNICLWINGDGNPDLAGVGVVTSYTIQLALALTPNEGPKHRKLLFFMALATTNLMGTRAALGPLFRRHQSDPILQACIDVSRSRELP
ncbi:hypothetical protein EJ08DRAFT_393824 [Tothia fuscella]|uniref:Uncharacterized protein n=1 Tax=Tothia fuscella TaxID=1048955 RepID=A0A9P4P0M4_9PEZI|nr:hypothetical protein EJ08DRAFT_393824 [Tothia fuscella]